MNKGKIVRVTSFFTSFLGEKEYKKFVQKVTKKELKVVLASIQKDKSPSLDSWTVGFFIEACDWMEEELSRDVLSPNNFSMVVVGESLG